jgi:hypothetical protein
MISAREAALMLLVSATAVAAPTTDEMARCAGVAAPDTRLACYDALAHRPADKVPVAAVPIRPPASAQAPALARLPAAQASESDVAFAADPKNFGLAPAQQHLDKVGPKVITAHIAAVSAGQSGQATIVLDSGQTWAVSDNDGRLAMGDAVTIKKATLGAFLMMTPSNHSYRVKRLN